MEEDLRVKANVPQCSLWQKSKVRQGSVIPAPAAAIPGRPGRQNPLKEAGKNNARKCNNKPERLFAVKADVEEELAPQLHADHGDLFHLWCLLETRPRGKSLCNCMYMHMCA